MSTSLREGQDAVSSETATKSLSVTLVKPFYKAAPLGIELDSLEGLRQHAERVYQTTVINRTMPLANLTQMTDAERYTIANWFENRDKTLDSSEAE